MSNKIRFAIIGCGMIGIHHAKQIAALSKDAILVAVADEVEDKAKTMAAQYGADYYTDYRVMLHRSDVDVVNICTPSGMHGDQAIACAKSGKHCIVEKPMDLNLQKADQMIESFRTAGLHLSVVSQHRFDSATIQVKRAIEAGKFGKMILGTAAVNWFRPQSYYDSGEWRGTWALDGGGALMNQSIHSIDLLQYLLGPLESVHAQCATLGHERIEVEDVAVASLKFRSGALGTIVGTTCAYPGLTARLEIFAEKATAIIDGDVLSYLKFKADDDNVGFYGRAYNSEEEASEAAMVVNSGGDPNSVLANTHCLQFMDVIQSIREKRHPLIDGSEGRAPLEIVVAIYESARTGKTIYFPL